MKMNILELHEIFCNERTFIRNFTPATIKWYKVTIGLFLKRWPDVKCVDEITTTHLQRFLYDGRMDRKWTAETFVNYYKGIKGFLNWCVKKGYMASNPI